MLLKCRQQLVGCWLAGQAGGMAPSLHGTHTRTPACILLLRAVRSCVGRRGSMRAAAQGSEPSNERLVPTQLPHPPLAGCSPPRPFVQEMAEAARLVEPRLPEFQPWEVSVLLWGAARLGYQPSPAQAVALQARVAELAQQQPDSPGTLTAQVGGRWSPTALPGCGGCAGRRAGCIV